jgi:chromosome segregation ATPase
MTEEEELFKIIDELKKEIDAKDKEIGKYVDKVENLEEEIMKLNELMSEKPSKKRSKKFKESKLQIELDAKDREIRELKDKMGFLRKEKLEVQQKFENIKTLEKTSSIIRVEELREKAPLNMLVKELQNKLNKQESIIRRLKSQKGDSVDLSEILQDKDEKIDSLKLELLGLKKKLGKAETKSETKIKENLSESKNALTKEIIKEIQNKLKKYKRQNEKLRKKLDNYKDKDKFNHKIKEYENKIADLIAKLDSKESPKLMEDKMLIDGPSESSTLKQVVEELKDKLNKSKTQISILQEQLKTLGNQKNSSELVPQSDIDNKLKIQREMASFLQQQLDEAKKALKTKEEEVSTIKNEAILIKRSYKELENQLRLKDKKISELINDVDRLSIVTQDNTQTDQVENPQLLLRIEELKTIIEDLTKQNIQQRLEIDQLRKSI